MATKKFSLAALSLAFIFAACGDDSSSNSESSSFLIENKTISGVSQKGPLITGSAIKLYELDGKTFGQTGKSFTGKITTDDGIFSVPNVTLASQYALLEANGYFRNEITGEKSSGTITLNALTDLSDREKVNINLLTHLEYERTLYLMSTGVDLSSAKKQAETEILNAFSIKGEFANSEDLDIFSKGDGNAALLAFSVLTLGELRAKYLESDVAELTERLTKFAIDIEKDGVWDDEETKAKIADWAAEVDSRGELADIRNNIEKWELGTVPEFEKYVRNFWYNNYGLGECGENNNTELKATINEYSINYGTKVLFICKNNAWIKAQKIDFDTYGEPCSSKEIGKRIDGLETSTNKYYCTANGWVSLTGDWRWDVPKEARLNPEIDYGTMTDTRDKQTYKTVKIGNQVWMAENLNYADSSTTSSLKGKSWCFDNEPEKCSVTGRLYTWAAAIDSIALYDGGKGINCGFGKTCSLPDTVYGICPPGWHLPTESEWNTLIDENGGNWVAGNILRSQTGWGNGRNGTDNVGFSALPAGERNNFSFGMEGSSTQFWRVAEENSYSAYTTCFHYNFHCDTRSVKGKNDGLSIRCIKNEE